MLVVYIILSIIFYFLLLGFFAMFRIVFFNSELESLFLVLFVIIGILIYISNQIKQLLNRHKK